MNSGGSCSKLADVAKTLASSTPTTATVPTGDPAVTDKLNNMSDEIIENTQLVNKDFTNLSMPMEVSVKASDVNLISNSQTKLAFVDRVPPNSPDLQYGTDLVPSTTVGSNYFKEIVTIWNVRETLKKSVAIYLTNFGIPQPIQTEIDKLNNLKLHLPTLISSNIITTYGEAYLKAFFLNKIRGNRTATDQSLVNMYSSTNSNTYGNAGENLLNHFFEKSGTDYFHLKTVGDAIYKTDVGSRRINNLISIIDNMFYLKIGTHFKATDSNLNFYKTGYPTINTDDIKKASFPNIFPSFGITDATIDDENLLGLLAIGGTQGVEVRIKDFNPIFINGAIPLRGYDATIIVQYKDTFGVDEADYTKDLSLGSLSLNWINFVKYNYRAGVLSQWILQHQYGYKTFSDFLTYEIKMKRTWSQK